MLFNIKNNVFFAKIAKKDRIKENKRAEAAFCKKFLSIKKIKMIDWIVKDKLCSNRFFYLIEEE